MDNLDKKVIAYLGRTPDWDKEVILWDDYNDNISNPYIKHWNITSEKAKPTDEQLNAVSTEALKLKNNATAISNRLLEYPKLSDIADAIFKKEAGDSSEFDEIAELRQNIKTKYPKE